MNATHEQYFQLGTRIGAALCDVDPADLPRLMAKEAVMNSPEAAPFHKELCKIAVAAFETAGDPHSAPANLFRQLAMADKWYPSYNRFTDSVRRALAKQAATLLPAVAALHDKAGGGVMKTLTAGGALGGAALGSLAFLLSRNAQQSSSENEALLEKVRAYKKLKRDIEEDMASRGSMDDGGGKEERRFHV
jgi:hypothetical protein